jgi:hypothetical protein
MIILSDYRLVDKQALGIFVKSEQKIPCPCCGEKLKVIGSRGRKVYQASGEPTTLRIRRLRCTGCHRIHHELPDCILPYKRYAAACLEKSVDAPAKLDVAADSSTLFRWNRWFLERADGWFAGLRAIAFQLQLELPEIVQEGKSCPLDPLKQLVGVTGGWLPRMAEGSHQNRPLGRADVFLDQHR